VSYIAKMIKAVQAGHRGKTFYI